MLFAIYFDSRVGVGYPLGTMGITARISLMTIFIGCLLCPSQGAVVRVGGGKAAGDVAAPDGFSVHKEAQPVIDALDEFERYANQEAWEKAFASLATAADAKPTGLIPAPDGFFIPTRQRLHQVMVALSPAGRQAYRLFNDANARQALDRGGPGVTADQRAALEKAADQYFISSVGDQATDRLGDVLFEAGDFSGAADCWRSILTDYPESSIPPLRLLAKRGIALTHMGPSPALDSLLATVRDTYAGQSVRLGGRDVVVADYLAQLKSLPPTTASTQQVQQSDSFAGLPKRETPLWQVPFMDDAMSDRVDQQLQSSGWGTSLTSMTSGGPALTTDDKRMYLCWLGVAVAIDLQTGKLLWRSDKFGDIPQRISNTMQYGENYSDDGIALAGDRLLLIRRPTGSNNYGQPRQVHCLSATTGKVLWSSATLTPLQQLSFGGTPIIDGDVALVVSRQQQQMEATLMAISIKDGSVKYQVQLGTAKGMPNFRGTTNMAVPLLRLMGRTLYVLTNNGALLAVNLQSRSLAWAFTYHTPAGPDPALRLESVVSESNESFGQRDVSRGRHAVAEGSGQRSHLRTRPRRTVAAVEPRRRCG